MAILAEPSANFHSSGMHQIPLESPESGRNLWGTDKTSKRAVTRQHVGCMPPRRHHGKERRENRVACGKHAAPLSRPQERSLPPLLGGINELERGGVLGSRRLTARWVVALLLLALLLPLHLLNLLSLVHPSPLCSSPLPLLDLLLLPLVRPPTPPQLVVVIRGVAYALLLNEVAVGGRRRP